MPQILIQTKKMFFSNCAGGARALITGFEKGMNGIRTQNPCHGHWKGTEESHQGYGSHLMVKV